MNQEKIIIAGGAGLVGFNLIAHLISIKYTNIVVLDKHIANLSMLKKIYPGLSIFYADLSDKGVWDSYLKNAKTIITLQAQIGGNDYGEFHRNNLLSTKNIIDAAKNYNVDNLIHISSSVINTSSTDFYTTTKRMQEKIILNSGLPFIILRPTLMFGWFDRKHLGWLRKFMKKTPIFPIPGNGKYIRQPLYVKDFCKIIVSCIKNKRKNESRI